MRAAPSWPAYAETHACRRLASSPASSLDIFLCYSAFFFFQSHIRHIVMSSLFGRHGEAPAGAASGGAVALVPATFVEGCAVSESASSNLGDSVCGAFSNSKAAAAPSAGIFSSSLGSKANGTVLCTSSTEGSLSAFGADGSSTPAPPSLKSSNTLQGVSKEESKAGGACFVGGSLLRSTSGGAGASTANPSALKGQESFTLHTPSAGGSLFGSAGGKSSSLLNTGSLLTAAVTPEATGAPVASPHPCVAGSEQPFNISTGTHASGGGFLSFGAMQGGETAHIESSSRLVGDVGDKGGQAATSSSSSPPQADTRITSAVSSGKPSAILSATLSTAAESKTGVAFGASGHLFGTSGGVPPPPGSTRVTDTGKTLDGAAQGGTNTSARLQNAGGGTASRGTTAAAGVGGESLSSSSASRGAGSINGALLGKPGVVSPSPNAAETNSRKGGQRIPAAGALAGATHSASGPSAAGGSLPPPQEVALETLHHELLEEVLARWERRLERRVEQFTAVAEEVKSVEKAMIEESRKIQQVMNEQGKLERKQIYTAGMIDSLEHQQRDLMTLLRSVEGAVLELRCGGSREISFAGKNANVLESSAVGRGRDAGVGFCLRRGTSGEEARGIAALVESDSRQTLLVKSPADRSAGAAMIPSFSSAEQLALERLRSFDQQLAEVGQNLSYTAETFQAGPLGAIAQVLAVHQAALRAATHQAAHIGERMRQLQESWEASRSSPGSRSGLLNQSGQARTTANT